MAKINNFTEGKILSPLIKFAVPILLSQLLQTAYGAVDMLIIGTFGVRIPVSYLMSKEVPVSLFHVGLATPSSTLVQIVLCFAYFFALKRKKTGENVL